MVEGELGAAAAVADAGTVLSVVVAAEGAAGAVAAGWVGGRPLVGSPSATGRP